MSVTQQMELSGQVLKVFCVAGTRPEYIKLFPVYKQLKEADIEVKWVSSGQHLELVKDLEEFFEIKPDYIFDLSQKPNKTLAELSSELLLEADLLFKREKPNWVIVQGDTATTLQAALAAFYNKIPVAHVEAGLRTGDLENPFPEELNRRMVSQISSLNFCPSQCAFDNLIKEGHSNNYLVGNTVIDSLKECLEKINIEKAARPFILITAHRRENLELIETGLAEAIKDLALLKPDYDFVIKLHANPQVVQAFSKLRKLAIENIKFLETLSYPSFVKLMAEAEFIVTDSGGIQEEAPYLGKLVLIFRNKTERVEVIEAGLARLIGTEKEAIKDSVLELIEKPDLCAQMSNSSKNIYGDGKSSSQILSILLGWIATSTASPRK